MRILSSLHLIKPVSVPNGLNPEVKREWDMIKVCSLGVLGGYIEENIGFHIGVRG